MASLTDVQAELRLVTLAAREKGMQTAPPSPDRIGALLQQGKAIYGSDSRVEATESPGVPSSVVRAVCVLVETDRLTPEPGGYALQTDHFGAKYNLCPGQRFRDQPLLGYGTGFLVAPDVIATAGHCIDGYVPDDICALFDFEVRGGNVALARPSADVFFVAEILRCVVEPDGTDYALLRLDRPVPGAVPLSVRAEPVSAGDPVYVVGHPVGLPKKVASGAHVLDNTPAVTFLANLDTFGGNSGSPVLTGDHRVCGILVRGSPDFVWKGNCVVATTFPLHLAGESVCRSSVWAGEVTHDKLARLRDIAGGGAPGPPPPPADRGVCLQAVEAFLCAAFDGQELRRLARHNLALQPLVATVNWQAARADVVADVVERAEQLNLLGDDFFAILKMARPRRADEVDQIRRLCSAPRNPPPALPDGPRPAPVPVAGRSPDRQAVYQALLKLSPNDFGVLVDIELDPEARLVVGAHNGQTHAARAVVSHYDVPYRGLDQLAAMIRRVAPGLI